MTDDLEKGHLHTLLGGLNWHAQQVAPHVTAEVGVLLSEVKRSTIETMTRSNKLLEGTPP